MSVSPGFPPHFGSWGLMPLWLLPTSLRPPEGSCATNSAEPTTWCCVTSRLLKAGGKEIEEIHRYLQLSIPHPTVALWYRLISLWISVGFSRCLVTFSATMAAEPWRRWKVERILPENRKKMFNSHELSRQGLAKANKNAGKRNVMLLNPFESKHFSDLGFWKHQKWAFWWPKKWKMNTQRACDFFSAWSPAPHRPSRCYHTPDKKLPELWRFCDVSSLKPLFVASFGLDWPCGFAKSTKNVSNCLFYHVLSSANWIRKFQIAAMHNLMRGFGSPLAAGLSFCKQPLCNWIGVLTKFPQGHGHIIGSNSFFRFQ